MGIDSKNGEVAVSGWLEKTKIKDMELAKKNERNRSKNDNFH